MAAMAVLLSFTSVRDIGNRMTCRQNMFRTSTGSRLAAVWVSIMSTPSEELRSTPSEEFGSTSASSGWVRVNIIIIRMCLNRFCNWSTDGQPTRSTYSMVFGLSIRNGQVMDRGYLGDVGKHTRNPWGARRLVRYSALGRWFVADSWDQWWQLWLWI